MEEDKLLISLMQVFIAQMDSALKISNIISTRNSIEIAELLNDSFTIEEAAEVLIYPLFSDEGGNDSERIYIRQIVQKYLPSKSKKGLYERE